MPHAPELQSQVRALAHRLAAGQMSWVDYRDQRAALVTAIARGEQPLEYAPARVYDDSTMPKDTALSHVLIDTDAPARPKGRWAAILAVVALALALVAAGWILLREPAPPAVATAPVVTMSGAEAVLDDFLRAGDWTPAAMADALDGWHGYSEEQRALARRSATWRRLRTALRQQINQQQVLATVDDSGEAARLEARLVEFRAGLED